MLSQQAMTALGELEAGAKLNCIHTVARELIAAGMAFDGWGSLEITEMGRRAARGRRFHVRDDQVADLWNTPADSHGVPDPDFELLPVGPDTHTHMLEQIEEKRVERAEIGPGQLAWSRERAQKAAGAANGVVDVWVDERWICAFMDAYEQI